MLYKIGDKLKPKAGREGKCGNYKDNKGEYIVITGIDSTLYRYGIYSGSKKVKDCYACFQDDDLESFEEPKNEPEVSSSTWHVTNQPINPKKHNFMIDIIQQLKDLTLSAEDRILRDYGFETLDKKMTDLAHNMMREELTEERWAARRLEVAENLLKLKDEKK